jgi:hypothetical protein
MTDSNSREIDARNSDIATAITELAFLAWSNNQPKGAPLARADFDRVYLGHYASIDGYADHLIDTYQLDAKLDAAIAPPFRAHVDIDVPGLARALRASGALLALPAHPVGVWVFRTDPDFPGLD